MTHIFRFTVLAIFTAVFSLTISAATFDVNTTADTQDAAPGNGFCRDAANNCSLRAAITEANALAGNDTINVPAGTYTQSIKHWGEDNNAGGDWDIRSNITIVGTGRAGTIVLQAHTAANSAADRVLDSVFASNVVTITNVSVVHGKRTGAPSASTQGGGIRNLGTMTLNSVAVGLNTAPMGGGIYNEGNLTLNSSVVNLNSCNASGANCWGGGIHNFLSSGKTLSLNSSVVRQNQVAANSAYGNYGAGVSVSGQSNFTVAISGSDVSDNLSYANTFGGGMYVQSYTGNATVNITDSDFNRNRPVSSNPAHMVHGGGFMADIIAPGTMSGTWSGLDVRENNNYPASSTCNPDGLDTYFGGGIFVENDGTVSIALRDSRIYRNHNSEGSAIKVKGNGSGNFAATNVSVAGNCSRRNVRGAAVHSTGFTTVSFDFSTITENYGWDTGGIFTNHGVFELKNTVVSENYGHLPNLPQRDLQGAFVSQDYNHFGHIPGSGVTITGTTVNNTTGSASLIWSTILDGYYPGVSSPALNAIPAGINGCGSTVLTDMTGAPRPAGSACEKGAIEVQ